MANKLTKLFKVKRVPGETITVYDYDTCYDYSIPYYTTVIENGVIKTVYVGEITGTTCKEGESDTGKSLLPHTIQLPDRYVYDANEGWNAYATSLGLFTGDAAFSFSVTESTVGAVVGLNDGAGTSYPTIEYGILFNSGLYQVIESGSLKGSQGTFNTADVFTVQRVGTTVRYLKNTTVVYSSLSSSTGDLIGHAFLYSGGDTVQNASIETLVAGSGAASATTSATATPGNTASASATTSATAIQAIATATTSASVTSDFGTASAAATTSATATGYVGVVAAVSFEPLEVFAASDLYAEGSVSFEPLESYAESGFLSFNTAIGTAVFAPLRSSGFSVTQGIGEAAVSFEPLEVLAADATYAQADVSFEPLEGFAGVAVDINYVAFTTPGFEIAAYIRAETNTIEFRTPGFSIEAYGGATVAFDMPGFTIDSSVTNEPIMRVAFTTPGFTIEATGLTGGVMTADIVVPHRVTIEAYSGAVVAFETPGFAIAAEGITGSVATFDFTTPGFTIDASISQDDTITVDFTTPGFSLFYFDVAFTTPEFTISAGSAVQPNPVATYSMNIKVAETTQYTNYAFDYVVRFLGKYYGVKSNGLYLLEGANDNGTSIAATAKTTPIDFSSTHEKRIPYMYLNSDTIADISTYVDDALKGTYRSGFGGKRARLARGPRGRYWAFQIQNVSGGALKIDAIEPLVEQLKRKI